MGMIIAYEQYFGKNIDIEWWTLTCKTWGVSYCEDVPQLFLLIAIERKLHRFTSSAYLTLCVSSISVIIRQTSWVYVGYSLIKLDEMPEWKDGKVWCIGMWLCAGFTVIFLPAYAYFGIVMLLLYAFKVI